VISVRYLQRNEVMVSPRKKRPSAHSANDSNATDDPGPEKPTAPENGNDGNGDDSTNNAGSCCANKKQKVEQPTSAGKAKSSAKKEEEDKEDMAWICAECKEAECVLVGAEGSADFLICDGSCHRIFHIPCAGLTEAPSTNDEWLCQDCSRKEHACAYCGEYGADYVNVFPCQEDKCGLFFCEACLRLHDIEYAYATSTASASNRRDTEQAMETEIENDENVEDEESRIPVFTCHGHRCWTCTQKDMIQIEKEERAAERTATKGKGKSSRKKGRKTASIFQCKQGRLFRCLYCPIAYHITCIPPTAKFHELAVLCHEHAMTHKLPELDLNESFQSQVESRIDKTLMKLHGVGRNISKSDKHANAWLRMCGRRGLSTNPFFPGLRGDKFDAAERDLLAYIRDTTLQQHQNRGTEHPGTISVNPSSTISMILDGNIPFCLPSDIKTEVYSKPPSYTHIQSLRYADPNNRPKKIPGPAPEDQEKCKCTGSFCGEDCFNRHIMAECIGPINCNLGDKDCGNRGMSKRKFVKCQPKREPGKGWGLVTLEHIPKGKLVQEYVGEVVDEKEKEHRLRIWNEEHPNDPNFYVMELSAGFYIDARVYANQSRFINHSCAPNCNVMSVNVKGRIRNGIYSTRDIDAGEFLSYDYHFDTKQGDRFVCRCGAPNCRGTMKGGKKSENGSKKAATWKEIKARYEADRAFLKELNGKDVITLKNGLVPGAENPNELVARGPLQKHRKAAIDGRIFLWRNVKLGANFVSRHARLGNGSKSHR